MMTSSFWTWATVHWWLAFWLMFWALVVVAQLLSGLFVRLPNRLIRSANIRRAGWPPVHLDADGDFKPAETNARDR